ncbi:MAG: hypothetical protein OYH77_04725, partial [Pseudomonadota bacterium]|nr:hypothetical protein [Pseudomonadota bacterium]
MSAAIISVSPAEYFRQRVAKVVKQQQAEIDYEVEFYIVNMMCDFIQPVAANSFDQPLALNLLEAMEATGSDQQAKYKALGDNSVYVAGFFQESLARRCTSVDYHAKMGSVAYHALSSLVCGREKSLYEKLAASVATMIDIMAEVGMAAGMHHSTDI